MGILNNKFTPLNQNHNQNTHAATNSFADKPQKQTCHYGTLSIVTTASKAWNDILRASSTDVLYCEFTTFKKTIFETFH